MSTTTAAATPPKLPKLRFKHKLILILTCLVLMALLRKGFVFFIIGMLPCIVAHYVDVSKNRYTFKSVFACNLSGMLPFVVRIIHEGPSSTLLQETMGKGSNWFIIYGAALLGLALVKICPIFAQAMVQGTHQATISRYAFVQKKLESEWGTEVKDFSEQPKDD